MRWAQVLEALVVETMAEQPEDPFDFMSKQMFKLAESFEQLRAGLAAQPGGAPAPKPDGWWTKWKGPDVSLSLEEKVALASGVAEEIIKDANELRELFKRKAQCVAGPAPRAAATNAHSRLLRAALSATMASSRRAACTLPRACSGR